MINFYHIPIKRKRQDVLAGKTNLRFISELISQLRILLKKKKKKENVQLRTRFDEPFRFFRPSYDLKNCGRGRGKKVTPLGALTQPNVSVNCTPI